MLSTKMIDVRAVSCTRSGCCHRASATVASFPDLPWNADLRILREPTRAMTRAQGAGAEGWGRLDTHHRGEGVGTLRFQRGGAISQMPSYRLAAPAP